MQQTFQIGKLGRLKYITQYTLLVVYGLLHSVEHITRILYRVDSTLTVHELRDLLICLLLFHVHQLSLTRCYTRKVSVRSSNVLRMYVYVLLTFYG